MFDRSSTKFHIYHIGLLWLLTRHSSCTGLRNPEVIKSSAIGVCQHIEGGYGIFESPDGDFCCNCPAGTFVAKMCKPNHFRLPESRMCKLCPFDESDVKNQTFTPSENNQTKCLQSDDESSCDDFMNTHRKTGSKTENSRCVCNEGYHTASGTYDVSGGCHMHSPCDKGFAPSHLGNYTHDTQCYRCPNGTYSNTSSSTDACISWTQCGFNESTLLGNTTYDTACAPITFPQLGNLTNSDKNLTSVETVDAISDKKRTIIIAFATVGAVVFVVILMVIFYCCCWKRRNRNPKDSLDHQNDIYNENNIASRPSTVNGDTAHTVENEVLEEEVREKLVEQNGNAHRGHELQPLTTKDQDDTTAKVNMQPVKSSDEDFNDEDQGSINETCEVSSTVSENAEAENEAGPMEDGDVNLRLQRQIPVPCRNKDIFIGQKMERLAAIPGCLDCCIQARLQDHRVGKDMLKTLESKDSDVAIPFFRTLGLEDTDVNDIKKDYSAYPQKEIRHQCIAMVIQRKGRELTPQMILDQEIELTGLRECLMDVFFKYLKVCHSNNLPPVDDGGQ